MVGVLHLLSNAAAGGLTGYVLDLARAHRAAGVDARCAGGGGAWLDRFVEAEVPYTVTPTDPILGPPILRHKLGGWRPDLFHAHFRKTVLLARAMQDRDRTPVLYTLHLSHMPTGGPLSLLVGDLWGDHTHVASDDAADWLYGHVPPGRVTVIPHGVDVQRFIPPSPERRAEVRAMFGIPNSATVAAYVGRLEHPKNVHWLRDCLADNDTHLLVAGDGPDRPVLEGRDRIHLLGETDPLPVYQAADVLLLPSEREGFALVAAESIACGTPVIRTRTSGTTATIREGVTGHVAEVGDREAFAKLVRAILVKDGWLGKLRPRCRAFAVEHLDHRQQSAATLDLYKTLIHKR